MEIKYHVGLLKDYSNPKRVILQLRRNVDYMSCELWQYLGERMTTKVKAKKNKKYILVWINGYFHTDFTKITID